MCSQVTVGAASLFQVFFKSLPLPTYGGGGASGASGGAGRDCPSNQRWDGAEGRNTPRAGPSAPRRALHAAFYAGMHLHAMHG